MSSKVLYDVKGPKSLFEMTWVEVSDALKKTDIVIVPVGSTEQHGPHLPLGSDSIQATDMSRRIVEKLGKEGVMVVAAPTVPFGVSYHHMKFPGTISISSSLLSALIKEICKSLHTHGFRRFVLLLAHGGNFQTLKLVAQDLVLELSGASFLVPDWLPIMGAKYPEVLKSNRPKDEHHSGEGETARMLASTPSLVMLEKAKAFYTAEENDPYRSRPYTGSGGLEGGIWDMKDITPIGSMGNPLLATKETGEKLYVIIVDWLCQVIKAEFTAKK